MALINTVSPEKAEGSIKEAYEMFMKNMGMIPRPLEMMSVSPALFDIQLQRIRYFSKHPTLSFPLLAHIRYLVAYNLNYSFCMDFNKHVLKKQGIGDEDIRKMEADPSQSLLEENESAMLAFVVKAVKIQTETVVQVMGHQITDMGEQGKTEFRMFGEITDPLELDVK